MSELFHGDLSYKVVGLSMEVHRKLGGGFLEKVYENALRIELEALGLRVEQQAAIKVRYNGQIVGEYFADLLVEGCIIVEIKAVQTLVREHEIQLVNYLAATGIDIGLLINFGSSVQVKRKYREYKKK